MKERVAKSFDLFANKLVQFSQERGRISWWLFLFVLALALVSIMPLTGHSQSVDNERVECLNNERELRGVWLTNVDSDVLFEPAKTEEAIALLAKANFNYYLSHSVELGLYFISF